MQKRRNEEALAKFNATVAEIQKLLEEIREAADGDFDADPDTVDWSWVRNAIDTRNKLKDALDQIRGEGAYAR
jgi:hypothetical protein